MTNAPASGRHQRVLMMIMLAAVASRLLFAPTPGYDLPNFKVWQAYIANFGLSQAYSLPDPPVVYPPGYPYVLKAVSIFYRPAYPQTPEDGWSSFIMKFPILLTDLAIGWLIFSTIRGQGLSDRSALLGCASYLLNPGVIFNSAYWGGVDSLMGLAALGAVIAAARGAAILPFVFISLAILTKYQAAVLLPLVATIVFSRRGSAGLLKGLAAAAITTFVIYLPFIISGAMRTSFSLTFGSAIGLHPLLTVHAHNIWWLISMLLGSIHIADDVKILGLLSTKLFALGLLALTALLVSARTYRTYRATNGNPEGRAKWMPFAFAALLSLAFFELPTEMHENYLYLATLFGALVCVLSKRLWISYCLVSVGWTLNMLLMDPAFTEMMNASPAMPPNLLHFIYLNVGPTTASNAAPSTVLNTVVILGAAIVFAVELLKLSTERPIREPRG